MRNSRSRSPIHKYALPLDRRTVTKARFYQSFHFSIAKAEILVRRGYRSRHKGSVAVTKAGNYLTHACREEKGVEISRFTGGGSARGFHSECYLREGKLGAHLLIFICQLLRIFTPFLFTSPHYISFTYKTVYLFVHLRIYLVMIYGEMVILTVKSLTTAKSTPSNAL